MAETRITDDHFYFWIEYYNKKGEVTCYTDVNEEIDVYKDYIRYENYCPGVREDYYDFAYKLEGDKLMIKTINYERLNFGKEYETTLYKFVKNGKFNDKEMKKWFINHQRLESNWFDVQRNFKYRNKIKSQLDWFEFKEERNGSDHFTKTARDWIIKQIKNKNFKDK